MKERLEKLLDECVKMHHDSKVNRVRAQNENIQPLTDFYRGREHANLMFCNKLRLLIDELKTEEV